MKNLVKTFWGMNIVETDLLPENKILIANKVRLVIQKIKEETIEQQIKVEVDKDDPTLFKITIKYPGFWFDF